MFRRSSEGEIQRDDVSGIGFGGDLRAEEQLALPLPPSSHQSNTLAHQIRRLLVLADSTASGERLEFRFSDPNLSIILTSHFTGMK